MLSVPGEAPRGPRIPCEAFRSQCSGVRVCTQYGADTGATWGVDCGGTTMAGYFGTGLLFSYLLLFVNFFAVTYIRARLSPTGARKKKQ